MSSTNVFFTPFLLLFCVVLFSVTYSEECEVCVHFLERLYTSLVMRHTELSPELVEEGLIRTCAGATGKREQISKNSTKTSSLYHLLLIACSCYYLGASSDAAAKVTGEVSRPLSAHVPVHKICQRLQRRDGQICELRYEHPVLDWSRDALSKMRVLELKRVLASWGEECRACLEKSEFIDLIQEVAPKHSTVQHRTHAEEF